MRPGELGKDRARSGMAGAVGQGAVRQGSASIGGSGSAGLGWLGWAGHAGERQGLAGEERGVEARAGRDKRGMAWRGRHGKGW